MEYDNSMIHEWSKIREKELYFIREIARLKKLQKDKLVSSVQERNTSCMEPRRNISREISIIYNDPKPACPIAKNITADCKPACTVIDTNKIENIDHIERKNEEISEEKQWDINNELLLKSFEDEEEDKEETYNTSSDQNMELDEESLHNLDNVIEAMDIAGRKRDRFSFGETSLKMKVKVKTPTDQ